MDEYTPTKALIVVDVQNDFADPAGSLYVTGGSDVIPLINAEISRAIEGAATVVYTQDWHPRETPHFAEYGGLWPVHCVKETWGAELHPRLTVVDGVQIRKGQGQEDGYSAFSGTDLGSGRLSETDLPAILKDREVESLVVVGLAGDYCVKATALDAAALGFGVTVPLATTAFVGLADGDVERSIAELRDAGVEVSGQASP